MQFTKATRKKAKSRIAISAPAGAGKTMSALLFAKGLGGSIAVIDSETGSASLYAGLDWCPEFDVLELSEPYTPERYIAAIKIAENAGYDTIIVDSTTHEWNGSGGCLEINESLAASKFRGNTWSAWNETTPRHRAFLDAMIQSKCHVIATMRCKTETAIVDNGGRKTVTKLGMKNEQRDGIEYEFTVMFELSHGSHIAVATKDRTNLFNHPSVIVVSTGVAMRDWLESGVDYLEKSRNAIALASTLEELKQAWIDTPNEYKSQLTDVKDAKKDSLTETTAEEN